MGKHFNQLVAESNERDIFAEIDAAREEMVSGKDVVKKTVIEVSELTQARQALKLTQDSFAELLGVSVRTLQEWEQKRRKPSKSAEVLLKVAILYPEIVKEVTVLA